jgi:hypothetical protein
MRTEESTMPEKETIRRARKDKRQGKAPTTQAGEFVREEMHHVREGKHGARSTKQAIAIGLSKARRAGVKLSPPEKGTASEETRQSARHALQRFAFTQKPVGTTITRRPCGPSPRRPQRCVESRTGLAGTLLSPTTRTSRTESSCAKSGAHARSKEVTV